ncbi:MAG TPA: TonB-dependent receptor plug domain-containing protein, partial [Nevskiaceae bacterium]|nr:TonB-dependent receptor plug domain-containing protein [Nevskiaceae bacterium]
MKRARAGMLLLCAALAPAARGAQAAAAEDAHALGELSIEQLMNITVTSVAKKAENLIDAAAAVTALSADDLRRSGAGSVAEALRMVPGMDVAAVDASQWAISARGFNELYANNLLVLVDGRAVYTPVFAGTYWDLQQSMLQDLDRIETIRGPGGTLWGANAVNGVINVVSRSAQDTQGTLQYGSGGTLKQDAGARYGGSIGDDTWYRVFGSYRHSGDFPLADGSPAGDRWSGTQGGFRLDRDAGGQHFTWQGDATRSDLDDGNSDAYNLNTLVRWKRGSAGDGSVELQAYYDRTHRNDTARARTTLDTADVAFQQIVEL